MISNTLLNQKTGMAIVCPITNTDRKIPFHVRIDDASTVTGFVMVDQVKSIDFSAREAKFIEKSSSDLLNEALAILDACVY
ncbi:MAG: type II toxin-antitoxin system PemK/MazF family toxin [Desulfobacteraceae bacterium]|nr:MAG: type II toxin-antitoxin system PemK/MazF family toxin [Desulfobacteraceae bacterium]